MAQEKTAGRSSFIRMILAGIAGCAASVVLVVLFAFILQKQWLPSSAIPYINMGIKLVAAAAAALIAALSAQSRAPLRAAAASGLYMVLTFLLFSLFSGSFSPGWGNLLDLAACMLAGLITGMAVNLVKK